MPASRALLTLGYWYPHTGGMTTTSLQETTVTNTAMTCSGCLRAWVVVPSTMKAVPGYRTQPTSVKVPTEDVYGNRVGPDHMVESSQFIRQGAPVALAIQGDDRFTAYVWTCPCGSTLRYEVPTVHTVPCQHEAGPTGVCRVRDLQERPPMDRYVNPRHGAACPCCGHLGVHHLRLGQTARCGATPEV